MPKSPQTREEAQTTSTCDISTALRFFLCYLREVDKPDKQLLLFSIPASAGYQPESNVFHLLLGLPELNFHTTQISGTQNYLHWEDTGILGAQSSENHDLNHSDFSWRENTMLGINKSEYGTIIVYKTCTCPHKIWHSSWMGDSRA